ncbi:MAG TPA: hypothetical protein VH186_25950 [Chloroflexia bacterium]|nr:hypothetical protein [Chloroflexia bacterium]
MSIEEIQTNSDSSTSEGRVCIYCEYPLIEGEYVPLYGRDRDGKRVEVGGICQLCYDHPCQHCHGTGCLGDCSYD